MPFESHIQIQSRKKNFEVNYMVPEHKKTLQFLILSYIDTAMLYTLKETVG